MRECFYKTKQMCILAKPSLVTNPIKVIKIIINHIVFNTDNYWGFPTSDIHQAICLKHGLSLPVRPNSVCK